MSFNYTCACGALPFHTDFGLSMGVIFGGVLLMLVWVIVGGVFSTVARNATHAARAERFRMLEQKHSALMKVLALVWVVVEFVVSPIIGQAICGPSDAWIGETAESCALLHRTQTTVYWSCLGTMLLLMVLAFLLAKRNRRIRIIVGLIAVVSIPVLGFVPACFGIISSVSGVLAPHEILVEGMPALFLIVLAIIFEAWSLYLFFRLQCCIPTDHGTSMEPWRMIEPFVGLQDGRHRDEREQLLDVAADDGEE